MSTTTKKVKSGDETQFLDNRLQEQAANAILKEPIKFRIEGVGNFSIKPLKLGTLVSISKQSLKIDKPNEKASILNVLAQAESAIPASKIIAMAILNSRWKIKLFSGFLAKRILWKLTPAELSALTNAVITQSNATFFFSCISLYGAMRIMEAKDM